MRLINHFAIRLQAALLELLKDGFVGTRNTPGSIHIFDANQPFPLVRASI
jgi:hypothetical protein